MQFPQKQAKLIKSVGSQERLPLEVSDYVGIRREKSEFLIIFGCCLPLCSLLKFFLSFTF